MSLDTKHILNDIAIASGAPPDLIDVSSASVFDNDFGAWEDDDEDTSPPDLSHGGGEYTDIVQSFLEDFEPECVVK